MSVLTNLLYIAASVFFIYGLKMLGRADTARRGNLVSAIGMLLAVVATLLVGGLNLVWVAVGVLVGAAIGAVAAYRVKMTAMPEMVALFNGSGGLASLLVGWAEYHRALLTPTFTAVAIFFAVLIGGVAFTGSLVAFGKLSERLPGRPILFPNQHLYNAALGALALAFGAMFALAPDTVGGYLAFALALLAALVLGVTLVIPIGGADMPIVISLLNAYSGIAASAAGFVLQNNVLIVAGSLVGASGLILTSIMCKAMNRSLTNVLFGGFGAAQGASAAGGAQGEVRAITADDAYFLLEAASNVLIVPGYGMAVAQAQHAVKELADLLEENGAEVRYAIHPVAGRMPGHMNVLLAEANVPYEQLVEPDDVNPTMDAVDVAIVIGANDVVNPAARENPGSPLYGMPIIDVDRARTVFVLKRSLASGFSGVENPLFFKENARMLFGDAKGTVSQLVAAFKEALRDAA
ncbi:NAD(P)(+) transhydrogenase (Re/Si-specific) subunit beta [Truepera radiovictrix]|uniref:NAD(P) transhydrogenase subunit beta n=1 Tax=Truepera radiovictrix (strain DSM 17093 / CIP 108686 / LMG 22925 / RQ-24) TaxID=649638 RepID=D7CXB4_TRURR|nr:NAD(P)(+) transhydrogenase (Re/Si-specific) subunit beta [Truepera radiovictrix]ADI13238.1 NAD(P)(+) transhydrogenase (AB-specific) [Truepera radiovictrix DSM 17093]WMT58198.1 NAD(P)(+) transhydrogenase (Re/Si-specific) subunit beta [Truepera radiovictrix]